MNICKSILIIPFLLAILSPSLSLAHAPNAMHLNYDSGRGELNVTVQHLVNDPRQHFVKEVVVYKDGRKVWSQEFAYQTSHRNLTIPPIKMAVVDGDTIRAVSFCNTEGKYEKTITVGAPVKAKPSGPIEHDIEK